MTVLEGREPVLEVSGLSVDFGVDRKWVPAAIDVEYTVHRGEVLAIVGESGSGKSVSSMAILDLLPKTARISGSIKLRGQELRGLSRSKMRELRGNDIAMIFQEPMTALNPVYTIGFQIVETLRLHYTMSPEAAKERALELLSLVELPDPVKAFNSYPHQLSGGQRQRAMIAQALSCDPALLIADEPTTALDVTVQAEILDLMRNLRDKLDSAVILITHDMGVVADLSDRIIVMRRGRIVESGTAEQIFHEPQHPYTQELLAAVPELGAPEHGADHPAGVGESRRGRAGRGRAPDPQPRRRLDRVPEAWPGRGLPGGRRGGPRGLPRRGRRSGRGVRLGQDDDRAGGGGSAAGRGGDPHGRRHRHQPRRPQDDRAVRRWDGFQDRVC